jgi:hypothetical protein
MFDYGIRAGFNAYYEENGKWPVGRAKQDIVDREIEKADKFIESRTRLGLGVNAPAAGAPLNPSSGNGSTIRKFNPATGKLE